MPNPCLWVQDVSGLRSGHAGSGTHPTLGAMCDWLSQWRHVNGYPGLLQAGLSPTRNEDHNPYPMEVL